MSNSLYTKVFGELLRELRRASGFSQEELAFAAELDRTYISLLELGKRSPTLDTIVSVSVALGTCPSAMLSLVDQRVAAVLAAKPKQP